MKIKKPEVGMLCVSTQGRDRGRVYVVCALAEEGFALVADGDVRRLNAPKRKNIKHLMLLPHGAAEYGADLSAGNVGDCMLAYAVRQYVHSQK